METEIEYELWQGDECVAMTSGESALKEIMHYERVYQEDGETEVFKVERIRTKIDTTIERMKD